MKTSKQIALPHKCEMLIKTNIRLATNYSNMISNEESEYLIIPFSTTVK